MLTDRIDTPIDPETKEKYRDHALRVYGLKLANWLRMLMQKDFNEHSSKSR